MRAHGIAVGAVAAALGGLGAGAALAASPTWHASVAIAPQGSLPGPPAMALASRGEALAAWRAWSHRAPRIEVRVRHGLRAPWSGPEILSARVPSGVIGTALSSPAVAMNARGDAVVLWRMAGGPVRSALRRGWTGPWRRIAVPSGSSTGIDADLDFALPHVAIAPDGAAVALWAAEEQGAWVVQGARIAAGAAAWQETPAPPLDPGRLAPPSFDAPHTAVDAAGDAVALWQIPAGGSAPGYALRAARRTGTGAWGPAVTLADAVGTGDVALAGDGRGAVVWTTPTASSPTPPVLLALGAPGAPGFSAPETLSGTAATSSKVAVNVRGDVLVAWSAGEEAHAAIRPAGGAWGATMSGRGAITRYIGYAGPPMALDDAGTGYVAVFDQDPDAQAHEWPLSVTAGTASGWGPAHLLGRGDAAAALATAPDGAALALNRSEPSTILASSYDRAPDVRVVARVRGRWVAGSRAVRWTVRVRNAGRIAAQGVRVRLSAGEHGRLLASRPAAEPSSGRSPLWRLGRIAPGAGRTIVALIRPRGPTRRADLQAIVSAAGMAPVRIPASAPVPSR